MNIYVDVLKILLFYFRTSSYLPCWADTPVFKRLSESVTQSVWFQYTSERGRVHKRKREGKGDATLLKRTTTIFGKSKRQTTQCFIFAKIQGVNYMCRFLKYILNSGPVSVCSGWMRHFSGRVEKNKSILR